MLRGEGRGRPGRDVFRFRNRGARMALPKSEHDLDKKGSVWSLMNQTLPLYVTFLSRISAAIYGNPRTFSTGCINSTHRIHPVSPAQPTPDAPGIPAVPDTSAMPDAHCIGSFAVLHPYYARTVPNTCIRTVPTLRPTLIRRTPGICVLTGLCGCRGSAAPIAVFLRSYPAFPCRCSDPFVLMPGFPAFVPHVPCRGLVLLC